MTSASYAYLHGFSSGPGSVKGIHLAKEFKARDVVLHLPDMNVPSFSELTYTGALGVMDSLAVGGDSWNLIGSSMGGYLAGLWASIHPEKVDKLVLLCPGFDMPVRWELLIGRAAMAKWRDSGSLEFSDPNDNPVPLHYAFYEDAMTHPMFPELTCPTLILHGVEDTIVPIDHSRKVAREHSNVQLIELNDDHYLVDSIDKITHEVVAFLGL